MLTIKAISGSGVSLSDGSTEIVAYPKKVASGAVTLLSKPEENPTNAVLSWPGEYDIGGVALRGIGQQEGQKVSFVLQMDDIRVALPSSPLEEWSQADIERLGDVHVLVLPAENSKVAQALIDEIDPRMLVLVPGGDGKMDADVVKSAGATGKTAVSDVKLKGTGSLPQEGREVVVLDA